VKSEPREHDVGHTSSSAAVSSELYDIGVRASI